MPHKRFPDDWHFSELHKYRDSLVSKLKVPVEIKTLLTEIGLPIQLFPQREILHRPISGYQLAIELPFLHEFTYIPLPSNLHQNYRVLYYTDDPIYLCFNDADQTTVLDIKVEETDSQYLYINASITKFLLCLSAYRHLKKHIEDRPDCWTKSEIYLPTGELKIIEVYNEEGSEFYSTESKRLFNEIDATIDLHNASFWSLIEYI